jgi:RNA polymerase sigma-70 factor (ECF subfamily)
MEINDLNSHLSDKAKVDFELVKDALENGNQRAYAQLMERYRDSVYFMLLKMVKNKDDADDLTIEAFGKAFKRLHQYSSQFAFSTWLFKIATNNTIDFLRKQKTNTYSIDKAFEADDGSEMMFEIKSDALTPEEKIIRKEKLKHMRIVVEKLKPRYRQLIELRYFDELSYDEIATKLEMPLGTVKAQLFRAKDLLQEIMKHSKNRI